MDVISFALAGGVIRGLGNPLPVRIRPKRSRVRRLAVVVLLLAAALGLRATSAERPATAIAGGAVVTVR